MLFNDIHKRFIEKIKDGWPFHICISPDPTMQHLGIFACDEFTYVQKQKLKYL